MAAQQLDGSLKDHAIRLHAFYAQSARARSCAQGRRGGVCETDRQETHVLWAWPPTHLSMGAIMSRSCDVISITADFLSAPDKGIDTSTPRGE